MGIGTGKGKPTVHLGTNDLTRMQHTDEAYYTANHGDQHGEHKAELELSSEKASQHRLKRTKRESFL